MRLRRLFCTSCLALFLLATLNSCKKREKKLAESSQSLTVKDLTTVEYHGLTLTFNDSDEITGSYLRAGTDFFAPAPESERKHFIVTKVKKSDLLSAFSTSRTCERNPSVLMADCGVSPMLVETGKEVKSVVFYYLERTDCQENYTMVCVDGGIKAAFVQIMSEIPR